jgi:hypothetical protein
VANPVQTHLDGAIGDAEPPRDRLLGQILVIAKLEQLAVARVQPLQRRVQIGTLDGREDPLVLLALPALDRVDRVGANSGVLAERLVADDRRQPLLAPGVVTQRRASSPCPQ